MLLQPGSHALTQILTYTRVRPHIPRHTHPHTHRQAHMAIGNAFSVAVKKARESHFTLFYEHLLRAHDVTVLFPSSRFNFRGVKCNHSGCGPGRSYGYGSLGTLAKLQPILRSPCPRKSPSVDCKSMFHAI